MVRNRLFNSLIVLVLVMLAGLTAAQYAVAGEVVSASASDDWAPGRPQGGSADSPAPSNPGRYEEPRDSCFDLSVSEAAICRREGLRLGGAAGGTTGEPVDTCFDVSVGEICDA
jgi:hypothetical protein